MYFIIKICSLLFFISSLKGQETRQYINGDNVSSQMIVNDYGNNRTTVNSTHRSGKNLFGVLGFLTGYRLGQGYGANSQGNLNLFGKMFNGALHLAYSKSGLGEFGQQFPSDYTSMYPSYPYSNYPYFYSQYNNPQIPGFPTPYHFPQPQHPQPPQFPPAIPPLPPLPPPGPPFPFPPVPTYPIPPAYPGHHQYPVYPTHPPPTHYYPAPTNNPPLTSPANQQQIVNIHEPLNANDPPQENYQEVRDKNRQSIINRINEPGQDAFVRGGEDANDEAVYADDNDSIYDENDDSENRTSPIESSEVIYKPVNRKNRPKVKKVIRLNQGKSDDSSEDKNISSEDKQVVKKPSKGNGNDIIVQVSEGKPTLPPRGPQGGNNTKQDMKKPEDDNDSDDNTDDEDSGSDYESDSETDDDTTDSPDDMPTTEKPQIPKPPPTGFPGPFVPGMMPMPDRPVLPDRPEMPQRPEIPDKPEMPEPEQRPPDINTMKPFVGYGPSNGNENISIVNAHAEFRPSYPYIFNNYIPTQYESHPIKIVDPHALEIQDEHKPWSYYHPERGNGNYGDTFTGSDNSYNPQYNHFDSFEFNERSRKLKSAE